ncbi:hypothetical protein GALMADRAFT_80029 [Galerina marginata CBS 339.88]|uniref:Uncharacterized protein n=1 Tax=Galerina marginata (strain CBS 339.88) TaxID=685588 RepID=A0A067S8R0_GALM3|nr:hypothetical protein GALMADRAFT_80029 [Galerina marginata CBS 339.88]
MGVGFFRTLQGPPSHGGDSVAEFFPAYPLVLPRRRPSETWLNSASPGWMDGAYDPPICYHSHEEVLETLREFRPDHPLLLASRSAPIPDMGLSTSLASSALPQAPALGDGHLVSVTMAYSLAEPGKGSKASKSVLKKHRNAKIDYIKILELDRAGFICEIFWVHELSDQYSPGVHSGPPFKVWWPGSPGGKTGAMTINSDCDYSVMINALLKKNKNSCQVGIEFDIDTMDGFRIKKRVSPLPTTEGQDDDVELLYGTKVPRVEGYSAQEQLHGEIIVQLKQKWVCEKHQGEHGEPGACYVDSAGNHLGLNNRKLKIWASAIAAADATKHEPPNTLEFDGIRDGRLSSPVKSRGRGGPRRAFTPPPTTDPATLLVTAMIPFLTGLASGSASSGPVASVSSAPLVPSTPVRSKAVAAATFSPMPTPTSHLHACLADFARIKHIDLTQSESALVALDLTPDIIPNVPVTCLCEVINVVEGQIYKFQSFCKDWTDRLEEKKRHCL